MNNHNFFFKNVTLLVTHYNRSTSLERLLRTFKEQGCSFEDIVVSDDGSKEEHLKVLNELQKLYSFQLITTSTNRGLGNNINKGQDAVKTLYTLYVQEDFIPQPKFAVHFKDALEIMDKENSLDMIRFYSYIRYPYLKPYGKGYLEMVIKPWFTQYKKIYYYSDHPHLRRSNFLAKFGRYAEGLKGDKTEYWMCVRFIQKKGRGLFFEKYKDLFVQENFEGELSTMTRSSMTTSKNFFITAIRNVYRQIKYNFDLNFNR